MEFVGMYDESPKEAGWYAVLLCWEPREGFFPGAAYWDGARFNETAVSHFIPQPFEDEQTAKDSAYENDPNW